LRDVDENLIADTFDRLEGLRPESAEEIQTARIMLSVKLMKSPFLPKRFAGLAVISKYVCNCTDIVVWGKFVESLLDDLHQELIPGFVAIFRQLIRIGKCTREQIGKFWMVSVE
jgi:hypothetical protein